MDHKVSKDMISSGMIPSGEKTQADLGRTQYGSAPSPSSLMEAYQSIYEHHQKDADGKVIEHGGKEELNEMRVKGGGVSTSLPKQKQNQKVIDKLTGYQQTQKGVGAASLIPKSAFKEGIGAASLIPDSAFSNPNPRRSDTRPSPTKTTPKPTSKPKIKPKPPTKPSKPYGKDAPLNMMTGLDLFDLVKGRLLDEGCDEQEAINIMVNLSEEELNELLGGKPGDGYLGHPNLGIKNPLAKKQNKKPVIPNSKGGGLINKTAAQIGDRNMKLKQMIDDI